MQDVHICFAAGYDSRFINLLATMADVAEACLNISPRAVQSAHDVCSIEFGPCVSATKLYVTFN